MAVPTEAREDVAMTAAVRLVIAQASRAPLPKLRHSRRRLQQANAAARPGPSSMTNRLLQAVARRPG
eukprot:9589583-Prorocentrum_lima.AAC.1